ncbi:serine hydrolase domain-containing protein [Actinoplanes sp. NBRC 103695]|uniref:serine hydrolase domain-containing protein n=1 Tax=Actinoplanes sp. NBRC 103695 TaxID=3032202 RepID=UPI0024A38BB8|nr:serine hydrolase domain-containing protein [Actinoplanes sp. NBRC 103695]GLY98877.1 serine hydrolase [Actinoplanes sp. NBRC 103695]
MPAEELNAAMAARVERGEMPGIVTLVARDDDVTVEAIGVTAFGGDVPMRRDTPFRIASMTKPILAAAALMLVEDGLFDLEEPVHRLLPELAGQRVLRAYDAELDDTVPLSRPVTVDDLLTFRLGHGMIVEPEMDPPVPVVRRGAELDLMFGPPEPRSPFGVDEWVRRFASLPLIHQPGEKWMYNTGTLVLGALISRATGQALGAVLADRIFEPLGMTHTGFALPRELAERLPAQYLDGKVENLATAPEHWLAEPPFPSGSGGLASTVDDFLAFARLLLNRGVHGGTRLLSEHSVELMTTNHLSPEQIASGAFLLSGSGWGMGLGVVLDSGRYGWAGGYGTDFLVDPAQGLIAIAMTQVSPFLWSGGMEEFTRLADKP